MDPVIQRIVFKHRLCFAASGLAPLYLNDLIKLRESDLGIRSSSQLILFSHHSRTKTFGNRAFSVASPHIWNSLPLVIASSFSPNLSIFLFTVQISIKNLLV